MNFPTVSTALLMSCLTAFPAYSQTVKGVVKDMGTNTPIPDASVVQLDDRGTIQRGTITEEE